MKFKWKYLNLFIFDNEVLLVIPFYKFYIYPSWLQYVLRIIFRPYPIYDLNYKIQFRFY